MGGELGVAIYLFLIGLALRFLGVFADVFVGGYNFGVTVLFTGLFYRSWRGNCIEFLLGVGFWGFALLAVAHLLVRLKKAATQSGHLPSKPKPADGRPKSISGAAQV